jgi:non-specific protein-tyrosine kinase
MKFKNYLPKRKGGKTIQVEEKIKETISTDGKKDRAGWISPIYSEAKAIKLDPKYAAENRIVGMFQDSAEINFYKILRTQIQQRTKDKGWNTIMITSVNPGEGKTLTVINLAITFAKEFNQTVLLVDSDLMRQNIHKYLGLGSDKGLIDYLIGDRPLKDFIVWPGIDKLTLISGGTAIHDSSELLGSPRMKSLINDMKTRYPDRYVFFDVPPILGGADAIVLAHLVDCIVLVVAEGQTSIHDIKKALQLLPQEKFLGFVLNRQKFPKMAYYYGYNSKLQ